MLSLITLLINSLAINSKRSSSQSLLTSLQVMRLPKPVSILFLAGFGVLFCVVQVAWSFLGDGSIFVGYLFNFRAYGKMQVWWTEAPSMYLQYGIYYLRMLFGGNADSFFPFTVISLISGLIYVAGASKIATEFSQNRAEQVLLFFLLLSSAGTLFFFGYMETYPLQYAVVLWTCYYTLKYLEGKSSLLPVTLTILLSVFLHFQNLLLLPALGFLYLTKTKEVNSRRTVYPYLLGMLVFLLVVYLVFEWSFHFKMPTGRSFPFIPLFPLEDFKYSLFNTQHLLDIVNENVLLALVPITLIVGCILSGWKKINWSDRAVQYLVINIFFFEAYLVGGGFIFGLGRDWDVTAVLGIFFAILAFRIFRDVIKDENQFASLSRSISSFALVSAISWLAVNINTASATHRYQDILEIYTPLIDQNDAEYGFENLRKFYMSTGNEEGQIYEDMKIISIHPYPVQVTDAFGRAQSLAAKLSPESKKYILKIVDDLALIRTDSTFTQEEFSGARLGKPHAGTSVTLGDLFEDGVVVVYHDLNFISLSNAEKYADDFITLHPDLSYGYELRARLMLKYSREIAGALPYLEKSLARDSMRTRSYLYSAMAYGTLGNDSLARRSFQKMVELDPEFLPGLATYTVFLSQKKREASDYADIAALRKTLQSLISAPAESATAQHQEEHLQIAKQAQELLSRLDKAVRSQ
ncbi:MAG: hypothetical protein WCH46_05365 [bacterium]